MSKYLISCNYEHCDVKVETLRKLREHKSVVHAY